LRAKRGNRRLTRICISLPVTRILGTYDSPFGHLRFATHRWAATRLQLLHTYHTRMPMGRQADSGQSAAFSVPSRSDGKALWDTDLQVGTGDCCPAPRQNVVSQSHRGREEKRNQQELNPQPHLQTELTAFLACRANRRVGQIRLPPLRRSGFRAFGFVSRLVFWTSRFQARVGFGFLICPPCRPPAGH
jgi:hypothetical protein